MKLLVVSEYSQRRGSGYSTITHGLLQELERRGHQIILLAFDYDGSAHPLQASAVPTDMRRVMPQFNHVRAGFKPDAVVLAYDLSMHYTFRWMQHGEAPYIGIFPVEADPLIHPSDWTNCVDTMHAALCETRFGTKLLNDVGITARYFPVGVDAFWQPPTLADRERIRAERNLSDRFVVLTVCDNHERKNLPAHYATLSLLAGRQPEWPPLSGRTVRLPRRKAVDNAHYIVNTKAHPQTVSYNNYALMEHFGVTDRCMVLEHGSKEGLAREELRELYWAADALLLLSKAEGLGLPVLEAMACGVPVVGTKCTGIEESLALGRGFLVDPQFVHIDPFQNQHRRWADPLQAAEHLSHIARRGAGKVVERALAYTREQTWARAADVFEEALTDVKGRETAQAEAAREDRQTAANPA